MDDLISRQAAIDALRDAENHAFNSYYRGLKEAHKIIADLPSAQSEPKTGRWIFEEGDGKTCVDGYICSACGSSYHTKVPYWSKFKFCPNCGAKMKGSRKSKEDAEKQAIGWEGE